MAKSPSIKDLDKAVELRLQGEPWKNVLPITGLSHSQAELHEMKFKCWLNASGVPGFSEWVIEAHDEEAMPQRIKDLRAQGVSWGAIGVRLGTTESHVRRLFKDATGVHSKGLRVGHGGRFAFDDPDLYVADPINGRAIPSDIEGKPELTTKGTIARLNPDQRTRLSDLESVIADRRAKRLEVAKKARPAKAKAKTTAKKVAASA